MKTYVLKHQDRATKPIYIVGADGIDVDHTQSIEQFIEQLAKSEMIQFHSTSVYNNEVYHTILTEDYSKYFAYGSDTVLKLLNNMEATPSNQWDKAVGFERHAATNETDLVATKK